MLLHTFTLQLSIDGFLALQDSAMVSLQSLSDVNSDNDPGLSNMEYNPWWDSPNQPQYAYIAPWIWKSVSATSQSGRYTLFYPRGRYIDSGPPLSGDVTVLVKTAFMEQLHQFFLHQQYL